MIGFVAGALMVPAVAYAASAAFTSTSSTTPAVSARNTGGGYAMYAGGTGGHSIYAVSSGAGASAPTIYGLQTATGNGASGVSARATGAGAVMGVYGVASNTEGLGVRGRNERGGIGIQGEGGVGVLGFGGNPGDGSAGVASFGDLYGAGHLIDFSVNPVTMGTGNDIAGTCTVAENESTHVCRWADDFPTDVVPKVVITPTDNPGGSYWITSTTPRGFTINMATAPGAGQTVGFNYMVVGVADLNGTSPVGRAQQARK